MNGKHSQDQDSPERTSRISVGDEFSGVTLKRTETSALTVDVSALSGVDVAVITSGSVRLVAPTPEQTNALGVINACVDKRAYKIGDLLSDGWVVGPASPDTGIVMAIEPAAGALKGYRTWYRGEDHAADLRGQGNASARQPTANELNALYNNVVGAGRNSTARFNTSGPGPYGGYWSSTTNPAGPDDARVQYFDIGSRHWICKDGDNARVRCIRDEPGLTLA